MSVALERKFREFVNLMQYPHYSSCNIDEIDTIVCTQCMHARTVLEYILRFTDASKNTLLRHPIALKIISSLLDYNGDRLPKICTTLNTDVLEVFKALKMKISGKMIDVSFDNKRVSTFWSSKIGAVADSLPAGFKRACFFQPGWGPQVSSLDDDAVNFCDHPLVMLRQAAGVGQISTENNTIPFEPASLVRKEQSWTNASDVIVTHVVDAEHFWGYLEKDSEFRNKQLDLISDAISYDVEEMLMKPEKESELLLGKEENRLDIVPFVICATKEYDDSSAAVYRRVLILRILSSVAELPAYTSLKTFSSHAPSHDENNDMVSLVFYVDTGEMAYLSSAWLFPIRNRDIIAVPSQVILFIVRGVRASPYLPFLESCAQVFKNMTQHNFELERMYHMRLMSVLNSVDFIPLLSGVLIPCPDDRVRLLVLAATLNIAQGSDGRETLWQFPVVESLIVAMKRLCRRSVGGGEGRSLYSTNTDEKCLVIYILWQMFKKKGSKLKEYAEKSLLKTLVSLRERMLVGHNSLWVADQLIEKMNGMCPTVNYELQQESIGLVSNPIRSGMDDNITEAARLSKPVIKSIRGNSILLSRRFVSQKEDPNFDDSGFLDRSASNDSLLSEKYLNEISEDNQRQLSSASFRTDAVAVGTKFIATSPALKPSCEKYVWRTLVKTLSDQYHELDEIKNIRDVSATPLSKYLCSFLNNGPKGGTIFFGISRNGYVHGMRLSQADRDNLRRGVDFMIGNVRPHLATHHYGLHFVPVINNDIQQTNSNNNNSAAVVIDRNGGGDGFKFPYPPLYHQQQQQRDFFVVEISVTGMEGTIYTLSDDSSYLRNGEVTYCAWAQDIRHWAFASYFRQRKLKYIGPSDDLPPLPTLSSSEEDAAFVHEEESK